MMPAIGLPIAPRTVAGQVRLAAVDGFVVVDRIGRHFRYAPEKSVGAILA